ncbi:MAG: hypothetical protein ACC628_22090 [Pirellulaceae bacterium]
MGGVNVVGAVRGVVGYPAGRTSAVVADPEVPTQMPTEIGITRQFSGENHRVTPRKSLFDTESTLNQTMLMTENPCVGSSTLPLTTQEVVSASVSLPSVGGGVSQGGNRETI